MAHALFVALLIVGRNGRPRLVAGVLTALVGALTVALLLTDGVDKPMWILVMCLELALATVQLGSAGRHDRLLERPPRSS